MIFAGIDIGSNTAKAALIKDRAIIGTRVIPTGYHPLKAGTRVFEELLIQAGLTRSDVGAIVSTGYGRASIDFADKAMTEILCHGAGACFLDPDIRGVIDVGGQDSKAIALDDQGQVDNFAMNDKCAAGTGRFLEVMAAARVAILAAKIRIQSPIMLTGGVAKNPGMIAALEKQLSQPLTISSFCQETGAIGAAMLASRL